MFGTPVVVEEVAEAAVIAMRVNMTSMMMSVMMISMRSRRGRAVNPAGSRNGKVSATVSRWSGSFLKSLRSAGLPV